jgi:hypothetical protein
MWFDSVFVKLDYKGAAEGSAAQLVNSKDVASKADFCAQDDSTEP